MKTFLNFLLNVDFFFFTPMFVLTCAIGYTLGACAIDSAESLLISCTFYIMGAACLGPLVVNIYDYIQEHK